ncbi:hypothetical protein RRG08_046870 [Elysia crispata]|uniref:Uncharacterized protein n=1 Tax=Elysia crispata TaxID=231223 RepID=A0AAE0ZIC4_9GAST|nr:hypothetical protein RRG08_046870 [Elysia crispata]
MGYNTGCLSVEFNNSVSHYYRGVLGGGVVQPSHSLGRCRNSVQILHFGTFSNMVFLLICLNVNVLTVQRGIKKADSEA